MTPPANKTPTTFIDTPALAALHAVERASSLVLVCAFTTEEKAAFVVALEDVDTSALMSALVSATASATVIGDAGADDAGA